MKNMKKMEISSSAQQETKFITTTILKRHPKAAISVSLALLVLFVFLFYQGGDVTKNGNEKEKQASLSEFDSQAAENFVIDQTIDETCKEMREEFKTLETQKKPELTNFPTPRTLFSVRSKDAIDEWWDTFCSHRDKMLALQDEPEKLDLLLLGDSITENWTGRTMNEPRSNAQAFLTSFEEGFVDFERKEALGISGDRTQHLLFRILHEEVNFETEIENVVVHIGVNNLYAGEDVLDVISGIKTVLTVLLNVDSIHKVHILPLLPPEPHSVPWLQKTRLINHFIKAWVLGQRILDTEEKLKKLNVITCGWDLFYAQKSLMPDHVHPTPEGMLLWAQCISESILGA